MYRLPPWIMTRHFVASCCVFCAHITSRTSRFAPTYLYTSCVFFPVVLAPRQRIHLWSCFTVNASGFSRGKIAPGTFFPFSFTLSCSFFFQFHLPFCYFELLWPRRNIPLRFPPCLFTFAPRNNPINARAPSLGPRLSLFSEVSYLLQFSPPFHPWHFMGLPPDRRDVRDIRISSINSIQIDPKYILSSMTILVLFIKYNNNTPNSGKNSY